MKQPLKLIAVLTLLVTMALPTLAEQTVTVSAVGEVKVKPDTLVLSGEISETNEKMKDAVTGFNDTRRRALAAVKELGVENLEITTSALSVGIAGAPQGGPFGGVVPGDQPATPGALQISQSVTLTVKGIDKMEEKAVIDLVVKLLAGVKEAGVDMNSMDAQNMMMMQMGMGGGGGGAATFKVSDPIAAHKAATKAAVEKARADAAYLAELAGGKLGPVVRISDGMMSAGDDSAANPYMMIWGAMLDGEQSDPYTNTTLDEITVARPLSVSFQLITE
ncbi:MAG: SIMPL domain-containing protein [Phycisphaeraceae bacterium]|nr:SIMPL domain-containing protein [Phycisphaeraceae bacterium]